MIEWMALLQKISAKLFPQNQPKPLFKSSDKIEETVEEMIKQQNFSRSDSSVIGNQVGESSTDIKTAAPNRDQSSATMTDSNPNITIIEGVVHSK